VREKELLDEFARRINSKLVAFIPRDEVVQQAEIRRKTVIEWAPESEQSAVYNGLAKYILDNTELTVPTPMEFDELEELVYQYGN
ncbi:MAG: nitrogenase iron protein, partial [bacterium]